MGPESRRLWLVALLVGVAGCSRGFESRSLGLRFDPPAGMKLVAEEPLRVLGSVGELKGTRAIFEDGLEIDLLEGLELPARTPLEAILAAAGTSIAGQVVDSRVGTLGLGPCLRAEFKDGQTRTLLYYVPLEEGRGLLVRYRAGSTAYGKGAASVERALGTLTRLPRG